MVSLSVSGGRQCLRKRRMIIPFPLSVSLYISLSHCGTVSSVPPRLEGSPPRLIPWGHGWLSSPTVQGSHLDHVLRARSKAPITHMFMRITSTTHYKYYARNITIQKHTKRYSLMFLPLVWMSRRLASTICLTILCLRQRSGTRIF